MSGEGDASAGLWVFGYASLIWEPGFPHDAAVRATLHGCHRALCIYSWIYRGTRDRPGLAFGLDRGGSCEGMALHVPPLMVSETLTYLHRREMVTHTYREVYYPVTLHTEPRREVRALCYIADRQHPQYAGKMPPEMQAAIIRTRRGRSGRNVDYVLNTARHLRELGIHDPRLDSVVARLPRAVAPVCLAERLFNFRH